MALALLIKRRVVWLLSGLQRAAAASIVTAHRLRRSHVSADSKMAQQVQAKQRELQSKLEAMLASVEDERLRPMRKQGFLAMAKCCDLSDPSASGVLANSWRHHRRDARRERRRRYEPTHTPSMARAGPRTSSACRRRSCPSSALRK